MPSFQPSFPLNPRPRGLEDTERAAQEIREQEIGEGIIVILPDSVNRKSADLRTLLPT